MLKQRIITALLLLPAVFILLFAVELNFFTALIGIIVYLMALEWAKLSSFNNPFYEMFFALSISFINAGLWYFSDPLVVWPSISWPEYFQFELPLIILLNSLVFILLAISIVITYSKNNQWWQSTLIKALFGLALLPSFFVAFVSIRNIGYTSGDYTYGGSLLLFMFLMIWAADTGAYFTGKFLGKHQLAKVSPNKTWEGVLGGVFFSLMIGWFGVFALDLKINNFSLYCFVLLCLAIISVFGDLFESALKRSANIKDSGNLLPGHGGLLDRLDSTVTVAPFYFLTFSYFEWFNA